MQIFRKKCEDFYKNMSKCDLDAMDREGEGDPHHTCGTIDEKGARLDG